MTEQKKYDNNNEVAIWGNKDKEKPTDFDFKGNATVDGENYWVGGWKRAENANPLAPVLKLKLNAKDDSDPLDKLAKKVANLSDEDRKKVLDKVNELIGNPAETVNNAIPF